MISYDELVELRRRTNGERVLSVYLPGPSRDPALRAAPKTVLETALSRIRHELSDAPHNEREAFLAASEHVLRAVEGTPPAHGSGTVVFADEHGVRHRGTLLDSPSATVEWRDGLVVVPYIRTTTLARRSVVALIDSRRARVMRYDENGLETIEEFAAEVHAEPPLHMGDVPRGSFHSGVRGETGTDETERREAAAFDRMLHPVLHCIETATHPDLWLIIGGMPQSMRLLVAALPRGLSNRTELVAGLMNSSSDADIASAVSAAMSGLRERHEVHLVEGVLDKGRAGNRASIGWRETMLALQERAASQVVMSESFVERVRQRAEAVARLAMDGGSRVEIVSGEGGARLDAESEGVAADLRYPVPFEALAASGVDTAAPV